MLNQRKVLTREQIEFEFLILGYWAMIKKLLNQGVSANDPAIRELYLDIQTLIEENANQVQKR